MLLRFHQFSLARCWEAARAIVCLYLFFETDFIGYSQAHRWPLTCTAFVDMAHANHHVPDLLQQAVPALARQVVECTKTCSINACGEHGQQVPSRTGLPELDRPAAGLSFQEHARAKLLRATDIMPPSVSHDELCDGVRTKHYRIVSMPWFLPLRTNIARPYFHPHEIPAVLDLSYTNAGENRVECVYDLILLSCYNEHHFTVYHVFKRDGALPVFIYNDCNHPLLTETAQYENGNLVLPPGYHVDGAWYQRRV